MTSSRWIGVGLVATSFALTAALYPRLPDPMPTHLAMSGHPDGFVAKPLGPFVVPLLALGTYAIVALQIARSRMATTLAVLPIAVAALFLLLTTVMLRVALGDAADPIRALTAGGALCLAVVGNYFGKLPRNRWIGIRTPWTRADPEVWRRTHRLGGWLLVVGGSVSCLAALGGAPAAVAFGPVASALLIPAVYSYLVYRRLRAGGVSS